MVNFPLGNDSPSLKVSHSLSVPPSPHLFVLVPDFLHVFRLQLQPGPLFLAFAVALGSGGLGDVAVGNVTAIRAFLAR